MCRTSGGEALITNVHNYKIDKNDFDVLAGRLVSAHERVKMNPITNAAWLVGGFNLSPAAHARIALDQPGFALPAASVGSDFHCDGWRKKKTA